MAATGINREGVSLLMWLAALSSFDVVVQYFEELVFSGVSRHGSMNARKEFIKLSECSGVLVGCE